MKHFTFILFLFLFLAFPGKGQNVGDQAPDFTLKQLQGGNFTLSGQNGKVVFIFWMGYACPFCESSAPYINSEIINTFHERADFVAITVDTWDGSSSGVDGFKSQTGLNINYLLKGSTAAQNWNTTYDRLSVVDKSGKIVFKGTRGSSSDINTAKAAIQTALQVATAVTDLDEYSKSFIAYPNPFSTQTTIRFQLDKTSSVILDLNDISGKRILELANRNYPSGEHIIPFQKGRLESGIYLLRLNLDGQVSTRKLVIR